MDAFLIAFGVIFLAELGDKSQLMTLSFAARYGIVTVLLGLTAAVAAVNAAAVAVGGIVGESLPTEPLSVVAGVAFLGFAWWTLRGDDDEEPEVAPGDGRAGLATVTGAYLLAELGDKTMLATMALATANGLVGTWLGATLGIVVANVAAVFVGRAIGARLPARTIRTGSALLFAGFGLLLILEGARG